MRLRRWPAVVPALALVSLLLATACSSAPDPESAPDSRPTLTTSSARTVSSPGRSSGGAVEVSSVAELESALAAAGPGTVIDVAAGTYERDGGDRWSAGADGTAAKPITLRGPRSAVLSSDSITGDYGLYVTGDHWRIEGLSVADATKGIVLDGSVGTLISGVDVGNVGEEGIHFRSCSSDGVLQKSTIHDTGLKKPQFGEGVYVGSANSNWGKYGCDGGQDKSQRVRIEGNTFTHIAAEGADLKEGVDSGTLRGNTFVNAGYSGENSADSAIDVKANGWLVQNNVVRGPSGAALDGIQTHAVFEGYGTGNTFRGNRVEGRWPGFGVGLYPKLGNVVDCTNTAPDAQLGLVGDAGKAAGCG
jgi:hypothetical protein